MRTIWIVFKCIVVFVLLVFIGAVITGFAGGAAGSAMADFPKSEFTGLLMVLFTIGAVILAVLYGRQQFKKNQKGVGK